MSELRFAVFGAGFWAPFQLAGWEETTCITVIREAMEEAVRRGVPREAATDFLLGHVFCRSVNWGSSSTSPGSRSPTPPSRPSKRRKRRSFGRTG